MSLRSVEAPMEAERKERTYLVHVTYSMVHEMWVDASSKEEAELRATDRFCEETDFSDDAIEEVIDVKAQDCVG